ncbi:tyrosine-type recombinase/integrase [Noviherbaspirillum sp. 1P10PC]|uniref:tyrosine-type recombinase/integrase n=1 Tax=Noviherbaspirillum sp. 1P10PC TaxID=3132292 RepID=UPI0039A3EC9F
MAKLTAMQVEAIKARDKPFKKNVDTGLQVRVAVNGVKSWIVQYVVDRKQREVRLPRPWGAKTDAGHLSLQDARLKAQEIRALARQGIDVQIQQEQARQAETDRLAAQQRAELERSTQQRIDNLSVQDLFDKWIVDGVRRKDGNAELKRSFGKDVLPVIGQIAIKSLTEDDLRRLLRAMVGRNVNRLAVMTYKNLVQMFAWAQQRQPWRRLLIEQNPVDLIDIEQLVSADYDMSNERDRCLSEVEIRQLNSICQAMRTQYGAAPNRRSALRPLARTTELSLWIMLSTLCRVGELSLARWEHVDWEQATWFIPAENTKGSKKHQTALTVYLSDFALQRFRALHQLTGDTDWCFPALRKDDHVDEKSISKQVGDRQTIFKKNRHGDARQPMQHRSRQANVLVLSEGKNGDWTPHDLRRTGATLMQKLKVAPDVIDACLNHKLHGSKVRRHYLHHDYAEEMREAWQLLGARLEQIIHPGENVLPFSQRAR